MAWWDENPFLRGRTRYGQDWWGGRHPTTGDPQDWYDTPFIRDDPDNENAPYGEFERFLGNAAGGGFSGFDNRSQWGRSLFSRAQSAFDSAQLSNPALTWRQFLRGLGPNFLRDTYAGLTPQQKGNFAPRQTRAIF